MRDIEPIIGLTGQWVWMRRSIWFWELGSKRVQRLIKNGAAVSPGGFLRRVLVKRVPRDLYESLGVRNGSR